MCNRCHLYRTQQHDNNISKNVRIPMMFEKCLATEAGVVYCFGSPELCVYEIFPRWSKFVNLLPWHLLHVEQLKWWWWETIRKDFRPSFKVSVTSDKPFVRCCLTNKLHFSFFILEHVKYSWWLGNVWMWVSWQVNFFLTLKFNLIFWILTLRC